MKEYSDIYKEPFEDSLSKLNIEFQDFKLFFKEQKNLCTIHFGEGRLNPSTIAGIMSCFIKYKEQQLSIE